MTEQAKVPAIRFAGFTDPWEQRKLSEVATFGGGHTPPMADPDNYEDGYVLWVTSQDVKSNYLDRTTTQITEKGAKELTLYPAGSLVMVTRSGILRHTLPVAELRKPSTVNQDIRVILPQGECCGEWLLQFFISHNKELLLEFGKTGTTVESVDFGKIKDMLLYMPSTVEQQQIGDFFAKLDSLITLHQRKYDKLVILKKSMLEKMFPKDGESVPEIRFAGFTDPWEQRKLGDVASSFDYGLNAAATEYDGQNKYLRITDIDDETHEFSKSDLTTPLADLAMSADYLLKEGDLLFARTGASVGKTYLYRQFDGMVYFAGFLIRARIGEGADPEFAYQATLTDAYKKYVAITSQRSGQPGVNAQEYADYQLMLPSKTEQQQIGMTLRSLDDLITLHQRKYDKLVIFKKSMLEKMFPKDGESVPEIRFAGFTDPWEQRKLGELFEESDERASDREILSVSVANGIYPASESDRETNPGASLANYKIVHFGDVVYNSMRMWQGAVDASRYDGIVSPAYVVARPNSEVYARFFARLLRQPMLLKQYQQVSQGNSKDTQVLKFDDFASIGISMPASENEQRRIGGFFDRLDSLITLHQRKLELLQNIKKSLLDKMFA